MKPFFILAIALSGLSCGKQPITNYCAAPKEYQNKFSGAIIKEARQIIAESSEKKAVSFTLFGAKKIYNQGLLENILLARIFYPGWDIVVFIDPLTVPQTTIDQAKALGAVLYISPEYARASSRFNAINMDYDRFISRDVDSRFTQRELAAVADWMKQDWAILHSMRDQKAHFKPLQAGLWGAKTKPLRAALQKRFGEDNYFNLMNQFLGFKKEVYGDDERFLKEIILESTGPQNLLVHESFHCNAYPNSRGFPIPRSYFETLIGARILPQN